MIFKKFRSQIFGVELSAKEQQAVDAEINRQLLERHRKFSDDVDYTIMKILHDHRRFYEYFIEDNTALEKHYEMPDAGMYLARKEMNALGVNIEKWNSERSE